MDNRDRITDSTDGRIERAKDAALGKHDSNPSHADEAGEAVGGIGGVLAGAAIGSAVGPIGTILGGVAGAIGGWWSGRAFTEAASHLTSADDDYYRESPEADPAGPATGSRRVVRGGSWGGQGEDCRAAVRIGYDEDHESERVGMRVAMTVSE